MGLFSFFPIFFIVLQLLIICGIAYLIYKWVNRIISLKQEHNYLLREISRKMDQR